jgi:hypothetical protein
MSRTGRRVVIGTGAQSGLLITGGVLLVRIFGEGRAGTHPEGLSF